MKIEDYAFLKKEFYKKTEENFSVPLLGTLNIFDYNKFIEKSIKRVKGFQFLTDATLDEFLSGEIDKKEFFIFRDEEGKLIKEGAISNLKNICVSEIKYDGKIYEIQNVTVSLDRIYSMFFRLKIEVKFGDLLKDKSPLHFRHEVWTTIVDGEAIVIKTDYDRDDEKLTNPPVFSFLIEEGGGVLPYFQYIPSSVSLNLGLTGIANTEYLGDDKKAYNFRGTGFKKMWEFKDASK